MYDKETAATPNFIPASSTSTTTTTLPPLHETLNGDVTHLQEPVPCALSSASPASLPPIHPAKNNADSRMSIDRLVNQPSSLPQETEEEKARAVAEILQQLSSNEVTSLPAPVEPPTNNTATGPSLMDRFRSISEYASNVYQSGAGLRGAIRNLANSALPGNQSEGPTKMEDDGEGHSTAVDKDDATLDSRKRRPRNELRSSSPSHRQAARPHRTSQSSGSGPNASYAPYSQPSAVQRSRWHQVLLGGGTQIGGVSAAVSEETMKSLKYCIQWLTYATQHLERQIAILRQFIVGMTTSTSNALIPASASTLAAIKREVVETLRKVIDIVSKYAASCLPEHSKQTVRSFILGLPNRWATINRRDSATPSPVASPKLGPTNCHPTEEYAHRLLSLATESKDMLNSVNGIFSNTVCSAEAWVHRLKAVGVSARGAAAMGPMQFDSIPQLSQHQNGVIPNGYSSGPRPRRSSSSMRANHHRPPPPAPLQDDDNYSETSSDSEAEPVRMELNHHQRHELRSAYGSKQQQQSHASDPAGMKKRKKSGKEGEKGDRMDTS